MSSPNMANTPRNINDKYLTENPNCYNTLNKTNYTYFRDRMNVNNLNHRYNNNKSSTPFNHYNNMNNKNNLFVSYNGGPQKQFCPLITNANLSQFFKTRSRSLKFRKPCGCFSNFNISKYTPCRDYQTIDRKEELNNNYQMNKLPIIENGNMRYSNGFKSPQIKNNGKTIYRLKNNENDNYGLNNDVNKDINKNEEIDNNNNVNQMNNEVKEEKRDQEFYGNRYQFNYFNTKPRRRFHKVQIFNNYKPFLVDDFNEYADYE